MNDQSRSLCHYGVLGMKWGIRRFQPYPAEYDGDGRFIGKDSDYVGNFSKRERRKIMKAERKRLKKMHNDAYKKALYRYDLENAIARGDTKTIRKFMDLYSDEELAAAARRVQNVYSIASANAGMTLKYIERALNVTGQSGRTMKDVSEGVVSAATIDAKINKIRHP